MSANYSSQLPTGNYSTAWRKTDSTFVYNTPQERIEQTGTVFRDYDLGKIGLAYCTGRKAVKRFKSVFPGQYFVCYVGGQIELGN